MIIFRGPFCRIMPNSAGPELLVLCLVSRRPVEHLAMCKNQERNVVDGVPRCSYLTPIKRATYKFPAPIGVTMPVVCPAANVHEIRHPRRLATSVAEFGKSVEIFKPSPR